MTIDGYNPRANVDFWKRMAVKKKGGSPPELLIPTYQTVNESKIFGN
jgi:hypothetical protein